MLAITMAINNKPVIMLGLSWQRKHNSKDDSNDDCMTCIGGHWHKTGAITITPCNKSSHPHQARTPAAGPMASVASAAAAA